MLTVRCPGNGDRRRDNPGEGGALDFSILGPLEAADGAVSVRLTSGKQKALLGLLLLNADRVVPLSRIVDELWGDSAPETAQKMVQIYVSHLRKLLPDDIVRTRPPGYLVALEGHSLDLHLFERLQEEGRTALVDGRAGEAADRLRDALALWRGPALGEFEEPFAVVESARLEEQRISCLEERIEADLALARHGELVGELETLVVRHPLRERLRAQLMLALYRSGRHAEALESYRQFRGMLADELGIEPPARLKELERRILQQDASLDGAAPSPVPAARPARVTGAAAPAPASASPPGRTLELVRLAQLFDEALGGERRLIFVTGDAGIGKTTIVDSFLEREARDAGIGRGQCVEHRGAAEPYLPILEALGRLCRADGGQAILPLLARQAPMWLAQMPWLLDDAELEGVKRRLVGATQARMLREMLEAVEALAEVRPLVLVLEDLHWSDLATMDLLDALARRTEPARLLVVGTFRPGDAIAQEHPVSRLARSLGGRRLSVELAVGPLDPAAVEDYAATRVGSGPAHDVSALLHRRTGGNPLFMRTLLDSWLEQGLLDGPAPDLRRLEHGVPVTLRQLIEQTLEQLGPSDRELLGAASVAGQEFSVAAVAAALECPDDEVDARCDALAASGQFFVRAGEDRWPDGTLTASYRFAHDLPREVVYAGLAPRFCAQAHGRIGRRLEVAYRTQPKEIAAKVAEHLVLAGDARAIASLRLAAEQAFERLAHREALEQLSTGLEMLERLPEDPARWPEEFALQSMLAAAHVASRGWSAEEAEAAFARALELAQRLGSSEPLGWALFRLGSLYEVRGEYDRSEALLEQALALSGPVTEAGLLTDSHSRLACSLFHQGVFDRALDHAEQGLAAYDGEYFNAVTAAYGDDAGAACHSWAALSLWFLGYPDRARDRAQEAVRLAAGPRHRHGYAAALAQAATVEQCRLDVEAARSHAQAAIEAATRDGYRYRLAMAMVLHGWAVAAAGAHDEGIAELEQGIELSESTGAHMDDPYYLGLLADARARAGRLDAARAAIEAGLARAPSTRRFFFDSELRRLDGELLLRLDQRAEGRARLREAFEVARTHRSPSLQLRAALSLASHAGAPGPRKAARALAGEILATFTEGFDTHDLVAARGLVGERGSRSSRRGG